MSDYATITIYIKYANSSYGLPKKFRYILYLVGLRQLDNIYFKSIFKGLPFIHSWDTGLPTWHISGMWFFRGTAEFRDFLKKIYYDIIFTIRWKMNRNTPYFSSHSLYCVVSMVSIYGRRETRFLRLHLIRHIIILMYDTIMKSGGIFLNKFKMMCLQNNIII